MSILANRIFYINSENRLTGTSSNFTYEIDIPKDQKFDTCCVLAMTIPRSYYLIRAGQNTCVLTVDGSSYVITITPGNYTAITFQTVLLGILNGFGIGTFSMSLSTITGKYTYTYTGSGVILSFNFVAPSKLGNQMGFPEVGTFAFAGNTLVSQNVLDFISTSTLFLHSDMVMDSTSVLQEVYADNSIPFSNLVYNCQNPNMYSKVMQNTQSGVFNFSLSDEHDIEVNLNGQDICITLLLYKKENLTALFKAIFVKDA